MAERDDTSGWLFQMQIWGHAVTGQWNRLAATFEDRNYEGDLAWWDESSILRTSRLNGQPVPEWWALAGARGREDFHRDSKRMEEIRRG